MIGRRRPLRIGIGTHAGVDLDRFPAADLAVRKRAGRVTARIVARAADPPSPSLASRPGAGA